MKTHSETCIGGEKGPCNCTPHTPGPWHVGNGDGYPGAIAIRAAHTCCDGPVRIAYVYTSASYTAAANARLIAAAPDLLAALQYAADVIHQLGDGNDAFLGQPSKGGINVSAAIRAAIAKATEH